MTKIKSFIFTLLSLAMLSLPGCSKDEPKSNIPADACYDFVTMAGLDDMGSVFTMQRAADSPEIRYVSKYTFPKDTVLSVGSRLIILYDCQSREPYTSGDINLYGYRYLDNTSQGVEDYDGAIPDPLRVQSMTRTGKYINMQAQLSCLKADNPKKLYLALDPATADSPCPELYVLYAAKSPGANTFTGYASWDISQVWDLPSCQAITVIWRTFNGRESQTFAK